MRILVCGGRDFGRDLPPEDPLYERKQDEKFYAIKILKQLTEKIQEKITIISGMATGADTIGAQFAISNNHVLEKYPISRDDWLKYGKSAGPRRNRIMFAQGKPDWGIVFPGGNGTKDMCTIMKNGGIKVTEVTYDKLFTHPFESSTS